MKNFANYLTNGLLISVIELAGCSKGPEQSADITDSVRAAIKQAGLKDVTVTQDRAKGVITLGGHVVSENEKSQAEALTKPLAMGQVVAMEIAVIPVGVEKDAKAINTDIDQGIEKNLHAVLISKKLNEFVKYEVKNAVVTLHGEVTSQAIRAQAEALASGVPYVKQVVNTLQVKEQKATSTY